jgi:CpXC protein
VSYPVQYELTCWECRCVFEATLWTSVNATIDPPLKRKLVKRQLFRFECPSCRTVLDREYDLLYHDTEKQLMVWLKHPEGNGVMSMLREPLDVGEHVLANYDLRLVTDFGALLEKIHCFDNGFDDRIVEMLKLVLFRQLYGCALAHNTRFYFAGISKRWFRHSEMAFVSVTSCGEQSYHTPVVPVYDRTAQQFHTFRQQEAPKGEWLHVNQRYLEDILRGASDLGTPNAA